MTAHKDASALETHAQLAALEDEIDRVRAKADALLHAKVLRYHEALHQIADSHSRLPRDPVDHCTDLVRVARAALGEEDE